MTIGIKGTRPTENLTGGQIQQIMDKLLYDSVYLLTPHGVFDDILITILSSLVLDRRRKISSTEYDSGIKILCNLTMRSSEQGFEDLRQLKLERTVYLKILNNIVEVVESKKYPYYYEKWLDDRTNTVYNRKLLKVERELGIERPYLYYIFQNVKANLEEFLNFKSSILQQYINLTHKYAISHIKHKNKNLNYDDLFQNIVTAVSKALDKYDSSKGALTSYVKYWIINALNQDNSHGEGLAYEVSQTQRQKMAKGESNNINFSTSLSVKENQIADDSTPETIAEQRSCNDRLLRLIKAADVDGIFRLVNNIDEQLSKKEKTKMLKSMQKRIAKKMAVA